MANGVKFENNSIECKEALKAIGIQWLHEAGMIIHRQILDIYRVDTGQTKNSFHYQLVTKGDDTYCVVGSIQENAIWEEFGTGVYAENGNGRKTPWSYMDAKGKWHKTVGKTGTGALRKSFKINEKPLQDRLADMLKGLK